MFDISYFFQKLYNDFPSEIKSNKGPSSQPIKLSFRKVVVNIVYCMLGQLHQVHVVAEFTTFDKIIIFLGSGVWLKV